MQGTDETIDATVTGHPEMLIVHAVRDDGTKVGEIVRNYKNEQQPKSFLILKPLSLLMPEQTTLVQF